MHDDHQVTGEGSKEVVGLETLCREGRASGEKVSQIQLKIREAIPNPYLIFVTGTTGGARVKKYVRCKFFKIKRKKTAYFFFFGVFVVIFGCIS